jgi:hypothetical protein
MVASERPQPTAEAICEAVQRPNMRFVPIKSPEQTGVCCISSRCGWNALCVDGSRLSRVIARAQQSAASFFWRLTYGFA